MVNNRERRPNPSCDEGQPSAAPEIRPSALDWRGSAAQQSSERVYSTIYFLTISLIWWLGHRRCLYPMSWYDILRSNVASSVLCIYAEHLSVNKYYSCGVFPPYVKSFQRVYLTWSAAGGVERPEPENFTRFGVTCPAGPLPETTLKTFSSRVGKWTSSPRDTSSFILLYIR